ncbi:hypothetical protein L6452_15075 [Arctium lappa]|uniref:Uncharacterized protein n=1 Tax=Arctium lappa TaxID=4217 RepID=A0ACB9CML2_ARCLA|nr:hypothetical protein L6452_15075 [Arctium lappa]
MLRGDGKQLRFLKNRGERREIDGVREEGDIVKIRLCKIDSEGKARKVVGCSCLVVKVRWKAKPVVEFSLCFLYKFIEVSVNILQDCGEESEGLHIVQEYVKSH